VLAPIPEEFPVRQDEQGRWRVGNTRVLFDVVIYSFLNGNSAETITDQYPSLPLDAVYLALGYYLRHRAEIDVYLREQEAEYETNRREDEARNPQRLTREILLERLARQRGQNPT
jgi:uncharacterized protein (DUF433 family)